VCHTHVCSWDNRDEPGMTPASWVADDRTQETNPSIALLTKKILVLSGGWVLPNTQFPRPLYLQRTCVTILVTVTYIEVYWEIPFSF
jgi:hypothetical protein